MCDVNHELCVFLHWGIVLPITKSAKTLGSESMGGQVTVAGITDATALGRNILLILDVPTLLALITELGSSGDPVLDGRRWVSVLAHVVAINDSGTDMTKIAFLGPDGHPLPQPATPVSGRGRTSALAGNRGIPYDAADVTSDQSANWRPSLWSPDNEINPYRDRIVSRARDLVRNDGWGAGHCYPHTG